MKHDKLVTWSLVLTFLVSGVRGTDSSEAVYGWLLSQQSRKGLLLIYPLFFSLTLA